MSRYWGRRIRAGVMRANGDTNQCGIDPARATAPGQSHRADIHGIAAGTPVRGSEPRCGIGGGFTVSVEAGDGQRLSARRMVRRGCWCARRTISRRRKSVADCAHWSAAEWGLWRPTLRGSRVLRRLSMQALWSPLERRGWRVRATAGIRNGDRRSRSPATPQARHIHACSVLPPEPAETPSRAGHDGRCSPRVLPAPRETGAELPGKYSACNVESARVIGNSGNLRMPPVAQCRG